VWTNYFGEEEDQGEAPVFWGDDLWLERVPNEQLADLAAAIASAGRPGYSTSAIIDDLEWALGRGLVRRYGRFLTPLAPVLARPEDFNDLIAWQVRSRIYSILEGPNANANSVPCRVPRKEGAFSLVVCTACTAIFAPKRRAAQARHCRHCRKRPAAPALGDPGTLEALNEGLPVKVRVPRWSSHRAGAYVTGWQTTTVSRCIECREVIYRKSRARYCGATACESKHRRRA